MPLGQLVDIDGAVKAWALSIPEITALASGGVFLELPSSPTWPLLRVVGRVSGRPDRGEPPLDYPVVQIDAWGGTRKQAGDLAYAVAHAAHTLTYGTPMGALVTGLGASVERAPSFDPDPISGRARYTLDIAYTVRSAGEEV